MNEPFTIEMQPATPEHVLDVFRDWHRQVCAFERAEPQIDLTFDSTVWQCCVACDLMYDAPEWRNMAADLNQAFGIDVPLSEWKGYLRPMRKRRLRDVCDLIARHASMPMIRPLRIMDRDCLPGGAFLTIKAMLQQAGANADDIGPSTPLKDYTISHGGVFLGPISRLAPGALPAPMIREERTNRLAWGVIATAASQFALGLILNIEWMLAIGFVIGMSIPAFLGQPAVTLREMSFGDLRTFRDLSNLLAGASRSQPAA